MTALNKGRRWAWFFRLLDRLHTPNPVYYWFLDRLTDNNGWRPLSMRNPE